MNSLLISSWQMGSRDVLGQSVCVTGSAVLLVPNPFSSSIPGHSRQARPKGAAWSHGKEPLLHPCPFPNLILAKREIGMSLVSSLGGICPSAAAAEPGDTDLGLNVV